MKPQNTALLVLAAGLSLPAHATATAHATAPVHTRAHIAQRQVTALPVTTTASVTTPQLVAEATATGAHYTLTSRVLTSTDVGSTIQLRVTPTAARLDCTHQSLALDGTPVAFDYRTSGCWSGGVNLVATVSQQMVGRAVTLTGDATNAARSTFTGQVSIGSEVAQGAPVTVSTPTATPTPTPTPAPTTGTSSGSTKDGLPAAITGTPYLTTGTAAYWATQSATDPTAKRAYYNIGYTPSVTWFDGVSSTDLSRLGNLVTKAVAAGKVPQIALYGIVGRDCGSLSSGGHKDAASYRAWIDDVSSTIGTNRAVVIVEPDAISYCGWADTDPRRAERAQLLTYAAKTLHDRNPNVAAYLHAGSGQLDPALAARAVEVAGVQYLRGFAMNVSSDKTTASNEAWAEQFVTRLAADGVGNMHYVVDTSRNGMGPQPNPGAPFEACNNPNSAMGTRPTTRTTGAHADAYVWAKPIGESDGVCHPGDPASGTFFGSLAQQVVANSVAAGTIDHWALPA